jgi:predicted enzyme related to lactoylglutathione lyase
VLFRDRRDLFETFANFLSRRSRYAYLLCAAAVENGAGAAAPTLLAHPKATREKTVMSNADPRGKFVWHELLTTDAAAATAFYTKVVPWKTQSWDQDSAYSMWVAKSGPVGGIAKADESGAPRWLPYVGVSDMEGTVQKAKDLGATVVKEPTEIPNMGWYAVLTDPQGAEFAVYKSNTAYNGAAAPGAGEFTWHELATTDAKAALDFYTKIFGWEAGPAHDMGPAGMYHLFLQDGNQYGGVYVATEGGPNWLCYIGVEDAGKAAAAAKSAGGRVVNGPMEVPGGSWVAQVEDKEGVSFAIHEPKMEGAAKPAAEKAAKPSKPKAPKAPKPEKAAAAAPAASNGGAASSVSKPPVTASLSDIAPAEAKPAAPKKTQVAKKEKSAAPAKKKAAPAKKAAAGKKSGAKKTAAKAPAKKGKKAAAKGKAKAPAKKAAAKKAAGKKKSAKRAPAKKKVAKKAKKGRR